MRLWRDSGTSGGNPGAAIRFAVDDAVKEINRQVASRGTRVVNVLRNAELEVLRGQRSGNVYKVPETGRTDPNTGKRIRGSGVYYTASAPGEPPARRTGNLHLRWIEETAVSNSSGNGVTVTARLESGVPYAGYLENGTSRIEPRPFIQPIIDKAMPEVEKILNEPYR